MKLDDDFYGRDAFEQYIYDEYVNDLKIFGSLSSKRSAEDLFNKDQENLYLDPFIADAYKAWKASVRTANDKAVDDVILGDDNG